MNKFCTGILEKTSVTFCGIKFHDIECISLPSGSYALTISQIARFFNIDESSVHVLKTKEMEWTQVKLEDSKCLIEALVIKDFKRICLILAGEISNYKAHQYLKSISRNRIRINRKIERQEQIAKKYPEKRVQLKLRESMGGLIEVPCLGGRIDLLTDTEIIEVKVAKQWKSALGQLLIYSQYYPFHRKRMHLFGDITESFLSSVKDHCNKFNIQVTTEE